MYIYNIAIKENKPSFVRLTPLKLIENANNTHNNKYTVSKYYRIISILLFHENA